MKVYRIIVSVIMTTLALVCTAFATDTGLKTLYDFSETAEIQSASDEILLYVNDILDSEYGGQVHLTASEIDWNRAYKFYVGTNIFERETLDANELVAYLEDQDNSLWEVPIDILDKTFLIGLNKGQPLRNESRDALNEEQLNEIVSNVGKWTISYITVVPLGSDYRSVLESNLSVDSDSTFFVSGINHLNVNLAIQSQNGTVSDVIALNDLEFDKSKLSSRQANTFLDYLYAGTEYSYSDLQHSFINLEMTTSEGDAGKNMAVYRGDSDERSNTNVIFLVTILLITTFSALVYYNKKKSSNRKF